MQSIFCLAPLKGWGNQQLVKNCGALPLIFHNRYGFRAVMVGGRCGEYPYADTYLKDVEMHFYADTTLEAKLSYMAQHAQEMDVVVLHGFWLEYIPLIDKYKELKPDGRVYMETDANLQSQDRFMWQNKDFIRLLENCDVVGVSCRSMQKILSCKWPCKIEYLPNGFYNFDKVDMQIDFAQKENVILTVGRLGTVQKNNELLLEAFARIYRKLPGWVVQLTGNYSRELMDYCRRLYIKYPGLKRQVRFTGIISDKQMLMEQYKRAKIFALTSRFEGGTPNVIAEALWAGCSIVTTDIDGAEDATNGGKCGIVVPKENVSCLENKLLELCRDEKALQQMGNNARKYGKDKMDFIKVMDRLYYLLFNRRPEAWQNVY